MEVRELGNGDQSSEKKGKSRGIRKSEDLPGKISKEE